MIDTDKLLSRELLIKRTAQVGLIANGIVYSLVGLMTFLAAFDFTYWQGGRFKALDWLYQLPLGEGLLGIITVGLFCYAFWRFMQGLLDTEKNGKSLMGLANRGAFMVTGFVYVAFAYYAAKLTFGIRTYRSELITRETVAGKLLEQPYGRWMIAAIALGTMGVGLFQMYHALWGGYRKHVQERKLRAENQLLLIKTGKWGFMGVGVVWIIIGYMFLKSALNFNPREAGGDTSAFYYMEYTYGSPILGLVAVGLLCYGLFNFVRARYEYIKTPD
jgi:hypothetical protein